MGAAAKATRKAPGKTASETAGNAPPVEQIPNTYDPVMIALSNAGAARLLLVNAGELCEDEDDLEWIEGFADAALVEALAEARTAYVKAVGDKPAPAAEAAR